jgi:MoxR-like ATPase
LTTNEKTLDGVRAQLGGVIQGKAEAIELVLVGLLAGGHVLVEDVPGVGKTTLSKALARAFAVRFSRVQFTPDLLPADIVGSRVLDPRQGTFTFHEGPIFTHVLLADEINRASPRTQSALLEAMSEAQVTIDGETHRLPRPFFVIATQNPHEFAGTYPLPEAQLDRFLLRLGLGYPAPEAELAMLYARQQRDPLEGLGAVATEDQLLALQAAVREVEVKEPVGRYLQALVASTRGHREVQLGVSPRGALALFRAAQARALLQGRGFATPGDVQALAIPVLAHRLQLTAEARYGGRGADAVILELVRGLRVPL